MNDFSNFQSVFSWRYGSKEMRVIWSEKNKYKIWRRIWVGLATAQHKVFSGIVINRKRIKYNLEQYAPFAATEKILIEAVKNGADRQKMHELLRKISLQAWKTIQKGELNPIKKFLTENIKVNKYVTIQQIKELLKVNKQIGNAPRRTKKLSKKILKTIS